MYLFLIILIRWYIDLMVFFFFTGQLLDVDELWGFEGCRSELEMWYFEYEAHEPLIPHKLII